MKQLPFWNHNAAYYPWIDKHIKPQAAILDVGCGDGTLARYLSSPSRTVIAIDPYDDCIRRAQKSGCDNITYYCRAFEDHDSEPESFDAVIFAASLHHMDAEAAIEKAKTLLKSGGTLTIVGLASPGSLADWLIEGLRVLPAWLGTQLHKARSSEELNIPTSYDIPKMPAVRALIRRHLPDAKLRRGLYYRYLLSWTKGF